MFSSTKTINYSRLYNLRGALAVFSQTAACSRIFSAFQTNQFSNGQMEGYREFRIYIYIYTYIYNIHRFNRPMSEEYYKYIYSITSFTLGIWSASKRSRPVHRWRPPPVTSPPGRKQLFEINLREAKRVDETGGDGTVNGGNRTTAFRRNVRLAIRCELVVKVDLYRRLVCWCVL